MSARDQGFTLMELLLVLLIIGMLGGFGLSFYKGMEKIELSATANHMQSLIRSAQIKANGEGVTHIVSFYHSQGKCFHLANTKAIDILAMPSKISMKKTNFPQGKLYFRGKLSPSRGGTIVLDSKSYQSKITVLPVTGRVKVYPVTKK